MNIQSKVTAIDIIGHLLIWLLVMIFTLGLGAFFFPYSFAKFVLNRSSVVIDGHAHALRCELDVFSQLAHILLWIVISILTLGIGYFFYLYKVWNFALNQTRAT